MSTKRYQLYLTGHVVDGYERDEAARQLAAVLRSSPAKAKALLGGQETLLKRDLNQEQVRGYAKLLEKRGVGARIEPAQDNNPSASGHDRPSAPSSPPDHRATEPDRSLPPLPEFPTPRFSDRIWFALGILSSLFVAVIWCLIALLPLVIVGVLAVTLGSGGVTAIETAVLVTAVIAAVAASTLWCWPVVAPVCQTAIVTADMGSELKNTLDGACRAAGLPAYDARVKYTEGSYINIAAHSGGADDLFPGLTGALVYSRAEWLSLLLMEAGLVNRRWLLRLYSLQLRGIACFTRPRSAALGTWWRRFDRLLQRPVTSVCSLMTRMLAPGISASGRVICRILDTYGCILLGEAGYIALMQKDYVLNTLYQKQMGEIKSGEKPPVNNLPLLVAAEFEFTDEIFETRYKDEFYTAPSRPLWGWPPFYQRVLNVEDAAHMHEGNAIQSIPDSQAPAWKLVSEHKKIGNALTLRRYENERINQTGDELVDAEQTVRESSLEQARSRILDDFYNGWFNPAVFWKVSGIKEMGKEQTSVRREEVNRVVRALRHGTVDYLRSRDNRTQLRQSYLRYRLAGECQSAGHGVSDDLLARLGLRREQIAELSLYSKEAKKEYQENEVRLERLSTFMGTRIALIAGMISDSKTSRLVTLLVSSLGRLSDVAGKFNNAQNSADIMAALLVRYHHKGEKGHDVRIRRIRKDLQALVGQVESSMSRSRWVFDDHHQTLLQYIEQAGRGKVYVPLLPEAREVARLSTEYTADIALLNRFAAIWSGVQELNTHLNTRLAQILQKVENHYRLPKLRVATSEENALIG